MLSKIFSIKKTMMPGCKLRTTVISRLTGRESLFSIHNVCMKGLHVHDSATADDVAGVALHFCLVELSQLLNLPFEPAKGAFSKLC